MLEGTLCRTAGSFLFEILIWAGEHSYFDGLKTLN